MDKGVTSRDKGAISRILPWRYGVFLLLLAGAAPAAVQFGPVTGFLLGFDLAALIFLITLVPLFRHDEKRIREHARTNDANRTLLLVLTGIVSATVLLAVAVELSQRGRPTLFEGALIIATLSLAWLFSNIVYTLHYAYLYYGEVEGDDRGGLSIPSVKAPDYWDFAYFAFTLGMTFQTSDIEIKGRAIRRVALFHCLAAFVFNLGVIAFTINVLGG